MSDPSDPITLLNAALEGRYRIEREPWRRRDGYGERLRDDRD